MRFFLFTTGLLVCVFANASVIDDRVSEFTDVKTMSPIDYRGKMISDWTSAGEICRFLGYKIDLEYKVAPNAIQNTEYYDLFFTGAAIDLLKRDPSSNVRGAYRSVTCAR